MENCFLSNTKAIQLVEKYGTPLYVYDENILRKRCKEMHDLLPNKNFRVSYSVKANSNLELMKIVCKEDIDVDVMSPGEIFLQQLAGWNANQVFFIPNNVSAEEMKYAIDRDILISADSLSQLEMYGKLNPNSRVAVRFNPSVGLGHHDKVITAGKSTKFGVQHDCVQSVKDLLLKYNLKLVGINQHLGSLFLDEDQYIDGIKKFLDICKEFTDLEFIDLGGGFGVPYRSNEKRLDLNQLTQKLDKVLDDFLLTYPNKQVCFKIEPGRYIVAESGILLGHVYSIKENYGTKYIGTDLGFNVLIRPAMYDAYHQVKVIKKDTSIQPENELVTIVGNICESGDIIAKNRSLTQIDEDDIIAVLNAGAYGYAMSSNYNCRLKPAEVLICSDGTERLIRRRDTFEDLVTNFIYEEN